VNFNQKLENFHDLGEYSWDMQGNDLFSRFLPDLTEALHQQMDYAFTMTKNTYGAKLKSVDTIMFRHSISVYL
jgi:PA26 p53-induced protein (sestrin)